MGFGWQSCPKGKAMSDSMIRSIDKLDGEVFGVLARNMPSRLIEISRSGCLLESGHRMEDGTVGELRLEVDGELFVDDVRVTRCVRVEGSGSSYLVGAEFLQTRRPGEYFDPSCSHRDSTRPDPTPEPDKKVRVRERPRQQLPPYRSSTRTQQERCHEGVVRAICSR